MTVELCAAVSRRLELFTFLSVKTVALLLDLAPLVLLTHDRKIQLHSCAFLAAVGACADDMNLAFCLLQRDLSVLRHLCENTLLGWCSRSVSLLSLLSHV